MNRRPKEHCSFCCEFNRKRIPTWGSKTVVEVPGCQQCRLRYDAGIREARTKTASVQNELDELKAAYQHMKGKSKFLTVCRDSGMEGSDVSFIVGGIEISGHRAILADKSKVLEKMFENRTLKNLTGAIEIHDASHSVMEAVVNFCYSGEISFTKAVPPDKIMRKAHEYQIQYLKDVCESELIKRLTLENVPHFLKLSRMLAAPRLETAAGKFFKDNFDALKDRLFEIIDATVCSSSPATILKYTQ